MSVRPRDEERFALWAFVRAPAPQLPAPVRSPLRTFARLWLACLGTVLLTAPVALLGAEVSGAGNRVDDVEARTLAVLALVVAPLVEETAFRLPLAPFRPAWLVLAGAAAAFLVAPYGLVLLALAVAMALVPPLQRATARAWAAHFPLVFWGSALLFGLLHTFNWDLGDQGWRAIFLVPLLVLPQSGLGLVLGAARIRLGLAGSILLHAAYNGTVLAVTFL
jgi:hypothetical protein